MKIHLVNMRQSAYEAMLDLHRKARSQRHSLVEDPGEADAILFVGNWTEHGLGVVDSELPKLYPEKCYAYFDSDGFVPLLPGVYTNPELPGWGPNLRRAEGQMFIDVLNPYVDQPLDVEKKYLFSFLGGSTSVLRKKLYRLTFRRSDVLVENTSNYYHWDPSQAGREQRQKDYALKIAQSHFGLCPRGASAGGLRLFEVMQMGVAPVIISDKLMLPVGPDWDRIAIRIPERSIADLESILAARIGESGLRGQLARQAYEEWFSPAVVFNRIIEVCERTRAHRRIEERWIHPLWGFMLWRRRIKGEARGIIKKIVLAIFKLMGRKFIYEMNER